MLIEKFYLIQKGAKSYFQDVISASLQAPVCSTVPDETSVSRAACLLVFLVRCPFQLTALIYFNFSIFFSFNRSRRILGKLIFYWFALNILKALLFWLG